MFPLLGANPRVQQWASTLDELAARLLFNPIESGVSGVVFAQRLPVVARHADSSSLRQCHLRVDPRIPSSV
jgi:hypothetical protein